MSVHWHGATRLTAFGSRLTGSRENETAGRTDFVVRDPIASPQSMPKTKRLGKLGAAAIIVTRAPVQSWRRWGRGT